jgi:phage terminase large subunit-like protein
MATVPQMVRIVVAVDPSGSGDEDNADNDEIGIAIAGLGVDGVGYVLEDCSIKAGPATWGKVSTDAYDRHKADCIVGETNYGGDMVRATIQTARPRTPFKKVTASRGKHLRAEPFSALYEKGKVRHVGLFPRLEDELCALTTTGYTGTGSPNRADAVIWALAELFPGIVAGPKVERKERRERQSAGSWMG